MDMRRTTSIGFLVVVLVASVVSPPAAAAETCWTGPFGVIKCHASGGTEGALVEIVSPGGPGGTSEPLPPRRYLQVGFAVGVGDCWVWSRTPPGLDSWDNANDAAIIATRLALPQCPSRPPTPPGLTTEEVAGIAWEVFRSFELAAPVIRMEPPNAGITGLDTYVSAEPVFPLDHSEPLPGGRTLEVEARMAAVEVSWGDGATTTHGPDALRPYPAGTATHTYRTRTCSADYRATHPTGDTCHPTLDAYPVTVTYTWQGRYRYTAGWVELGTLDRAATVAYDVDEVVGLLEP